jgi:hypothetical protein
MVTYGLPIHVYLPTYLSMLPSSEKGCFVHRVGAFIPKIKGPRLSHNTRWVSAYECVQSMLCAKRLRQILLCNNMMLHN